MENVLHPLSDTLGELAEVVLKNNIFEFDEKTFKQKCGTTIKTKLKANITKVTQRTFQRRINVVSTLWINV